MTWVKTSADYLRWHELAREAEEWWPINHPDEPLNMTLAHEEYALRLRKDKDYFRLSKHQNPFHIVKAISLFGPLCPLCGNKLSFKTITLCPKANPRHYSGVFLCGSIEDDAEVDCAYAAYTVEGILDIRNKLSENRFADIKKIEV
jgi:hypothetical protein